MLTDSEIRNRSGERIDHSFHPGTRADALVILAHGVTGNKDRPHLVALAEGLAAHGWPCLRISFSGNGGSEGRFEDSCITKEIGDLQAVLDVVPDTAQVAYVGHSMGGAVGVLTAARDLRLRALVSLAGMTRTAAFVQREFSGVTPGEGCMWDDENCPLSRTYVDDLNSIGDILSAAEAVTQPWLLIHGAADDLVPVQDSRDAYAAAICEKQFLEIAGADHSFDETNYPQLIAAVAQWLKSSFGGPIAKPTGNFAAFETKMTAAGMGDAAIRAFRRNYEALMRNETGLIPEETIMPAERLTSFETIVAARVADVALLSQAVVIKLNGGLGTGMGLQGPKSLLAVRDGVNFLDLMVRQILDLRKTSGAKVRLLLMNSFSTSGDTLAHLEKYRADGLADAAEVELMQNQIPKIDAATFAPVAWPADPDHEWCPPGHGDLYPALVGSGWLDRLLAEGVKYAFVSNSDNLGAILDPAILNHFANSGAPFLMEVTRRTAADRKGGHLAVRKSDGRLLLREVAQCPDADVEFFQDIDRHPYFNTNSLWLRLDLLKEQLAADAGVLPLPMIRNNKTVDPRDKQSPAVVQLEIAMGAAIECFEGATAIEVPRSRFAPVKTTADLLALRSDAYEVLDDGQVRLAASRDGVPPNIMLSDEYKLVDQLGPLGVPSLLQCQSLTVSGPVHFADGVVIKGDVEISNAGGERKTLPQGLYQDATVEL